ncbi:hypothetical protein IV02_04705 [Pseudomonas syringae]|uniref:Uncharacterized protein n=1 Tax=Pseudomonas syringae TaxID=317 RepID=A0A085VF37_PSESX|nr:hypothetical protein IV02_04705 [Pseudomonas syringae]
MYKTVSLFLIFIVLHLWGVSLFPKYNTIPIEYFAALRNFLVLLILGLAAFYLIKIWIAIAIMCLRGIRATSWREFKPVMIDSIKKVVKYVVIANLAFLVFALAFAFPLSRILNG